jgi:hypothetical protein
LDDFPSQRYGIAYIRPSFAVLGLTFAFCFAMSRYSQRLETELSRGTRH